MNDSISRFNSVTGKMTTARKICNDWSTRIRMCTKLLFSQLYDTHILFCYISSSEFQKITTAINNAIRNTGFINTTPSDILYRSSIRYRPFDFCIKAIVTLGLKHETDVTHNSRTLKIREHHGNLSTFRGTYIKVWNDHIPYRLKQELLELNF